MREAAVESIKKIHMYQQGIDQENQDTHFHKSQIVPFRE